jgi:hypothetical protein
MVLLFGKYRWWTSWLFHHVVFWLHTSVSEEHIPYEHGKFTLDKWPALLKPVVEAQSPYLASPLIKSAMAEYSINMGYHILLNDTCILDMKSR